MMIQFASRGDEIVALEKEEATAPQALRRARFHMENHGKKHGTLW